MKIRKINDPSNPKKSFQRGQGIIEFIFGLAILVALVMGAILGFRKLFVLLRESWESPTPIAVPTMLITPSSDDEDNPILTPQPALHPTPSSYLPLLRDTLIQNAMAVFFMYDKLSWYSHQSISRFS